MSGARTLSFLGIVVFSLHTAAVAKEPSREFLEGLRQRQYFETAIDYLDSIENNRQLPEDVRRILPFERAMFLMELARRVNDPGERQAAMESAGKRLEDFATKHSESLEGRTAASERGLRLLDQARELLQQARSTKEERERLEFPLKARIQIGEAKTMLELARDGYRGELQRFEPFIDPVKNAERFEQRRRVGQFYVKAQLDVAVALHEQAKTWEVGSTEFRSAMDAAISELEAIHVRYRGQIEGHFAHLWLGKCYREQGNIGKALGVFNKLCDLDTSSGSIQHLQDQALHFRLTCLNTDERSDYEIVVIQAREWLSKKRRSHTTPVKLGIHWEKARALEAIGRRSGVPDVERIRALQEACMDLWVIGRTPGPLQSPAAAMRARLEEQLRREKIPPLDFSSALETGRAQIQEILPLQKHVIQLRTAGAAKERVAQAESVLKAHVAETIATLRMAVDQQNEFIEHALANEVRYLLAQAYSFHGDAYEAGILAAYIVRRFPRDEVAYHAACLALRTWEREYRSVPEGKSREFERDRMIEAAEVLVENWPNSGQADEARRMLKLLFNPAS